MCVRVRVCVCVCVCVCMCVCVCVCVRAELIELMASSKALRLKDSLDKNGIAVSPKSPLFSLKKELYSSRVFYRKEEPYFVT